LSIFCCGLYGFDDVLVVCVLVFFVVGGFVDYFEVWFEVENHLEVGVYEFLVVD